MGTIIKMADGETIRLTTPKEGVVRGISAALDRQVGVTDPMGNVAPRGFINWTDSEGEEVAVNVTQIASVRKERSGSAVFT